MVRIAEQLSQVFARPIAHRGLHGCGRGGPIENTVAAALAAIAGGYGIECDVQLSRDGDAMVFHDATLDRLTGFAGRVDEHDAEEIAGLTLADGSSIPTLRSFLSAVGGRTPIVVEIKSRNDGNAQLAERVLADVRGYEGVIALKSFDSLVVEHCREADCPIGLVGPHRLWSGVKHAAARPVALSRCDFLSWNIRSLDDMPPHVSDAPVMVWVATDASHGFGMSDCGQLRRQIVFEGWLPKISNTDATSRAASS